MPRTYLIQARVTLEELSDAELVAEHMRRTVSDAVRELIREKAEKIRARQKPATPEAEKAN